MTKMPPASKCSRKKISDIILENKEEKKENEKPTIEEYYYLVTHLPEGCTSFCDGSRSAAFL